MSYSTKQKDLLLKIIKTKKKEFTIKELYEEVKESVSLTTTYRLIDKLVNENIVSKTIGINNNTYYQYLDQCENDNHFYLKCKCCGELYHIDCECIGELIDHIYNKHKFTLDEKNIVINGVCDRCKEVIRC